VTHRSYSEEKLAADNNRSETIALVNKLNSQLDITGVDDWYNKLSRKRLSKPDRAYLRAIYAACLQPPSLIYFATIVSLVGQFVSKIYNGSLAALLNASCSSHTWHDWRFRLSQVPNRYWENQQNRRRFLEWAASQLNISTLSDWYAHSRRDLDPLGGM
jgi:hypothetical protein